MQGRLVSAPLRFVVTTECAHCARPLKIELDGELRHRVVPEDARPLIFTPHVDFSKLCSPSIIDDF